MSAEVTELERRLAAERARRRQTTFRSLYPASGPYARSKYPRHLRTFAAGKDHRVRALMGANRCGKSLMGAFEVAVHATGEYPAWWEGIRYTEPVLVWVAGDTGKTVRDIIQPHLVGTKADPDRGVIPPHRLLKRLNKPGVPEALELVDVQHVSGRPSTIVFKSYDQERQAFQGSAVDFAWLDEEPSLAILDEVIMRTAATGTRPAGRVLMTFTPLLGLSDVVTRLIPNNDWSQALSPEGLSHGGTFVIIAGWDDVPHLSEAEKADLLSHITPSMRQARTRGIPSLGSGQIYPIDEAEVKVPDFALPPDWPRGFGMDAAWNQTAVVWGAWDPTTDVLYVYDCYKRGQTEPPVHAEAIRSRGGWIPGRGDLAEVSRYDGRRFLDIYRDLGLDLHLADRALESGILATWLRLSTGRLRIFASCTPLFEELRVYRRDEQGQIVRKGHDLMDALRYLVRMTPAELKNPPAPTATTVMDADLDLGLGGANDWMA
jgi:phage terminase large subunit-like protein